MPILALITAEKLQIIQTYISPHTTENKNVNAEISRLGPPEIQVLAIGLKQIRMLGFVHS